TCSPKGSYTISSTARDGNAVTQIGSVVVNVAGTTLNNTVSCPTSGLTSGKAFTCTATTSGDTPPYTYTWTLPTACTGTSTTATISVTCTPKGSYSISSTARSANAVTATGSATAAVGGQPVTNSVSCGTGQTSGKAFTCTATTAGGTSPYTYTWTLPAACTGTSTIATISVTCTPKGSYTISSTARDGNAVTQIGSVVVNVAGTTLNNTVSCPTSGLTSGKAFTCTATTSGDTAPYTYTWTLPTACTGTSTT